MEIQVKEYEEKEEKVKRYEAEFEYAGAQYAVSYTHLSIRSHLKVQAFN